MRGAITLAAAQTLPVTAPHYSFLLLVAMLVAAGSLTIQGLSLSALVRVVRPAMAGPADDEGLYSADSLEHALNRLDFQEIMLTSEPH